LLPVRPDAFRRCLANLLDNAGRHGSRVHLVLHTVPRISTIGPGGAEKSLWAELTIDDDGPGIPAASREAAFRPFASGRPEGTGLGLAIARDIVRAHGGDIELEDSPLGGLRARLRLPI
jgi:two-component system osmolarity sensor histidine kinase EnvZ